MLPSWHGQLLLLLEPSLGEASARPAGNFSAQETKAEKPAAACQRGCWNGRHLLSLAKHYHTVSFAGQSHICL